MMRDSDSRLLEERDWIEVERVRRRARFPGEADSVIVLLRGETTQLRKTVLVEDRLGADRETEAILDCIAHKRFFGDW
jgi:hypothetical protein